MDLRELTATERTAAVRLWGDAGHRGWVYYLAVDVMHRRRGAGAALMAAAENRMRSRGVVKVNLMV